jgi:hypothetical protein
MNENENKSQRGPHPKQLVEKTILGLPVGRGDNANVVPPEEVEKLAAIGCTDTEIAAFFSIKQDTLRRNFAEQIAKGREYQKTRLRRAMFKNACDNMNAAVQIFLAKNILLMSDQPINGEANAPLPWIEGESTDLQLGADNESTDQQDHTID